MFLFLFYRWALGNGKVSFGGFFCCYCCLFWLTNFKINTLLAPHAELSSPCAGVAA